MALGMIPIPAAAATESTAASLFLWHRIEQPDSPIAASPALCLACYFVPSSLGTMAMDSYAIAELMRLETEVIILNPDATVP